MLSVRCLSCLSVSNIRALWPNGWTVKMKLGLRVGLGPGHIVLDEDPAPHPQKGTAPKFSAHICCGQMAACIKMSLGIELGLGPGDLVLDGDPALPSPKGGAAPQIFGTCILWPNGWMDKAST